jgi:hypothetical protein
VLTGDTETAGHQMGAARPCLLPALQPPSRKPRTGQRVKRSQPAFDDQENQVPGATAAPIRKAPVTSGCEVEDFGGQPALKRQKGSAGLKERQTKERIDPSLIIELPPDSSDACSQVRAYTACAHGMLQPVCLHRCWAMLYLGHPRGTPDVHAGAPKRVHLAMFPLLIVT